MAVLLSLLVVYKVDLCFAIFLTSLSVSFVLTGSEYTRMFLANVLLQYVQRLLKP